MVTINVAPRERSTALVTIAWYDEEDNAVTPTAATWSLYDADGNVVNDRSAEAFHEALATTNHIVLTGADLAVLTTAPDNRRCITLQATYNSTYGTGLTLTENAWFSIDDLVGVT